MGMALVLVGGAFAAVGVPGSGERRVEVTFEGGHETDPRDRGRPVALVAGALGVRPEAFREAFSRVRPAQGRGPTPDEARANKAALLGALGRYGINNERLDEVSNHYRYRRERGETWPTRAARAVAVVSNGRIVRFEVRDGGEGYSSAPKVIVPGFATPASAVLAFDRSFDKNGAVRSIEVNPR